MGGKFAAQQTRSCQGIQSDTLVGKVLRRSVIGRWRSLASTKRIRLTTPRHVSIVVNGTISRREDFVPSLCKSDIVQRLAHSHGYRRYLEITTTTTGHRFEAAQAAGYDLCRRLMYRCPPAFADGYPVHYRTCDEHIAACVARIRAECGPLDIILVDPHHTYDCSMRDLRDAFSLLRVGGTLVVHDCDPPDRHHAVPHFVPGPWCGVTYKAFLDFVIRNDSVDYYAVDADYGCGVIRKLSRFDTLRSRFCRLFPRPEQRRIEAEWMDAGEDLDAAYQLFTTHRLTLLRIMGADDFHRCYPPPSGMTCRGA